MDCARPKKQYTLIAFVPWSQSVLNDFQTTKSQLKIATMNLCTLVFKSTSKILNERTMIFYWTEANMVSGNVNMHPNCTNRKQPNLSRWVRYIFERISWLLFSSERKTWDLSLTCPRHRREKTVHLKWLLSLGTSSGFTHQGHMQSTSTDC